MTHKEKAKELFLSGYNCCQAVFGAFCDVTGMEFEEAMRLTSSMGAGMGGLREVCGAVSGAFLAAGLVLGHSDLDQEKKQKLYRLIQEMGREFEQVHGTLICRDLLKNLKTSPVPSVRTAEYYKQRPCAIFVEDMAEILDRALTIATEKHPL